MTIELCYTVNYLRALSHSIFIFVLTFKYFVLFLQVERLLYEVEFKLITFSNHFCVSELTRVEVFSFEGSYLVGWLDVMLIHKLFWKDLWTFMENKLLEAGIIHFFLAYFFYAFFALCSIQVWLSWFFLWLWVTYLLSLDDLAIVVFKIE